VCIRKKQSKKPVHDAYLYYRNLPKWVRTQWRGMTEEALELSVKKVGSLRALQTRWCSKLEMFTSDQRGKN